MAQTSDREYTHSFAELKPMEDDEFNSVVKRMIEEAENFISDDLTDEREKGWKYYNGETDLEAKPGRSQFVMRELRDTVESILPSLVRIFSGKAPPVEFIARRGPQDIPLAKQQTQYVRYIYDSDNPGFKNTYWFCKNALIAKTGIFETGKNDQAEIVEEEYEGLTQEEYMQLMSDPEVEPVDVFIDEESMAQGVPLVDVKVKRTTSDDTFYVRVVPPENLIINEDAECEDKARIIGEKSSTETVSDLVAEGYDYEDIITYASPNEDLNDNRENEKEARSGFQHSDDSTSGDPSMYEIVVYRVYVRVDRDGDGYAELHRVVAVGEQKHVIDSETWDEQPYSICSPYLTPHETIGQSLSDVMFDLQDLSTQLIRQVLDNLVRSNNPGRAILKGAVDKEALLANLYDSDIEVTTRGAIEQFVTPFVAGQTMPILEWAQERKELRTGTSKVAQGLDPEALQSSAEVGVQSILNAAKDKIELIARVLAEEGFAKMYCKLLRQTVKLQFKARVVRITGNQFVPMDPNSWHTDMDLETNVGLGNGSSVEKITALSGIAGQQKEMLAQGPNPYVTPAQFMNTLHQLAREAGLASTTDYWNTPEQADQIAQQMQEQAARQPSPQQQELQFEQQKFQQEMQFKQQESQQRLQLDGQQQQGKLMLDAQKTQAQLQLEAKKSSSTLQQDQSEAQMRMALEAKKAKEQAALDRWKAEEQAALARVEMREKMHLRTVELAAEAALEREQMRRDSDIKDSNLRRVQ